MSVLDQDEPSRKLKAWWKKYGTPSISGVLLALVALGGYNWWDAERQQNNTIASEWFGEMIFRVNQQDYEAAGEVAQRLINTHGTSDYAAHAAQVLARIAVQNEDWPKARTHLRWVIDNHDEAVTVHAARLRLVRILIQLGEMDAAQATLVVEDLGGFASHYLELQGDILVARGNKAQARTNYEDALRLTAPNSPYYSLLQLKLQNTAVAVVPESESVVASAPATPTADTATPANAEAKASPTTGKPEE